LVEARREEAAAAVEGVVEAVVPVPVPVPVVLVPVTVDKVPAEVVTGSSELVAEVSVVSVLVPVADTVLEEEPELETVAPIKNAALVA
jgi:hypothetical protein